jgi:hypothetical protein
VSKEDSKAIVIAAIEAGTATTRTCLFDGCSVDFPLGDGLKVQVLVPEHMSDVHNPLYRHVKVAAFVPDDVEIVASKIRRNTGPLPLFYGASGSGKTTCGIAMAAQLTGSDGKPGACIQLVCGATMLLIHPWRCADKSKGSAFETPRRSQTRVQHSLIRGNLQNLRRTHQRNVNETSSLSTS